MRSARVSRRSAGFTLLEVVVALAILSVTLSVILRIFSQVSGASKVNDDYLRALQIAENTLLQYSTEIGQKTRAKGVEDDYFSWTVSIEPYRLSEIPALFPQGDPDGFFDLYLLDVEVTWGESRPRSVQLSTFRIGDRW